MQLNATHCFGVVWCDLSRSKLGQLARFPQTHSPCSSPEAVAPAALATNQCACPNPSSTLQRLEWPTSPFPSSAAHLLVSPNRIPGGHHPQWEGPWRRPGQARIQHCRRVRMHTRPVPPWSSSCLRSSTSPRLPGLIQPAASLQPRRNLVGQVLCSWQGAWPLLWPIRTHVEALGCLGLEGVKIIMKTTRPEDMSTIQG